MTLYPNQESSDRKPNEKFNARKFPRYQRGRAGAQQSNTNRAFRRPASADADAEPKEPPAVQDGWQTLTKCTFSLSELENILRQLRNFVVWTDDNRVQCTSPAMKFNVQFFYVRHGKMRHCSGQMVRGSRPFVG